MHIFATALSRVSHKLSQGKNRFTNGTTHAIHVYATESLRNGLRHFPRIYGHPFAAFQPACTSVRSVRQQSCALWGALGAVSLWRHTDLFEARNPLPPYQRAWRHMVETCTVLSVVCDCGRSREVAGNAGMVAGGVSGINAILRTIHINVTSTPYHAITHPNL